VFVKRTSIGLDTPAMLALETVDLTKDYAVGFWRKQPRRVLDRLSLQVEAGQVFGLLGPNGAGKTTTLKILLRLVFPTSGQGRILGRDLGDLAMRRKIGFLPENPYFYDHLTPREFLNYAAELFSIPASERRRRVGGLLDRVGLNEARDVPLRKFSKGMVQRVGIAQALINEPEVVFLDEPMSGLDPVGRREVRDLLLSLRAKGITVFFSTHILSDAETICDRVAVLDRGKLQGSGDLRSILSVGTSATEVVIERAAPELLNQLKAANCVLTTTGGITRAEVAQGLDVTAILNLILSNGARIASLNPVRISLEDYFLARIHPRNGPALDAASKQDRALGGGD
jgi:ABC-2 type transport system ATP-binding protein